MFKIEFKTDGSSFNDNPEEEAVEMLRSIIDKLHRGAYDPCGSTHKILDSNGNTIGSWSTDLGRD